MPLAPAFVSVNLSAHDLAPGPAEATPGLAGLNVVRPRAGALRALHVDPHRGTGVDWHLPGGPASTANRPQHRSQP